MGKGGREAFSDGVIAIIITIMVLELKVPRGATIEALLPLGPVLLSYVLSFIYIGVYWNKLQYASHPSIIPAGRVVDAHAYPAFRELNVGSNRAETTAC